LEDAEGRKQDGHRGRRRCTYPIGHKEE
jgi:hypothetical protein